MQHLLSCLVSASVALNRLLGDAASEGLEKREKSIEGASIFLENKYITLTRKLVLTYMLKALLVSAQREMRSRLLQVEGKDSLAIQ